MKRFFPLLLGLTLTFLSFSYINSDATTVEECAVNSLIKICDYKPHFTTNQYQCDPSSGLLIVDQATCTGTMKVFLRVTNLATNPVLGQPYALPTGVESLFYEYTYGGNVVMIGPIDTFIYRYEKNNTPVFEWTDEVTFDLSNYCGQNQYRTEIFHTVRVTDNDHMLYDLTGHTGASGIFSCNVFEETCYYCGSSGANCQSPGDLEYDVLACGEPCQSTCSPIRSSQYVENTAIGSQSVDYQSEIINNEGEVANNTSQNLNLEISPNPFADNFVLTFQESMNSRFSISLLNTNCMVVLEKNYNPHSQKSVSIDANNLPAGVYYCRVINGDRMTTKKLVKI